MTNSPASNSDWSLAIDAGSSSVRGVICDAQASPRSDTFTQIPYQFDQTPDRGSTIDSDRLSEMIFACIDQVLTKAESHDIEIKRVVMDTFVGNVMGVAETGRPTTPLYTWADARGGDLVPALRRQLAPDAYLQRTGCHIHASYWPVRLAWLRQTEPEMFAKTRYWLSIGAYVMRQVFGQRVTSVSDAAWSGLLNRHTLQWDGETLDALGVSPNSLAEISSSEYSGLTGAWAERWPALREAEWLPAIGDGVASNIGMGCTTPERVALSVGTSGALRVVVPGIPELIPDGLFCYRMDAERSLLGGALSNAGNLYQWLLDTLHFEPSDDLETQLSAMPPDGHGMTVCPFLNGERSPFWDDRLPAVILGMSAATTPVDILRAGLEAVAFGYRRINERLKPFLPPEPVYVASGGAAESSPAFMQILTDVLGHPVHMAQDTEATIRGAVLFAAGQHTAERIAQTYTPDMSNHAIYAAAIERQEALLHKLRN